MRTATITIDANAIHHNLQQVITRVPSAKILAMVKANAYGHGIAAVLPALQHADGLGVATFMEALEARQLGWHKIITLIEGVFSANEWQQAMQNDCSCVIHHAPQLHWALDNIPPANSATRQVWLKYNTGMNRLGFDDDTLISAAKQLHKAGYQLILTTHFANADTLEHPLNALQIERFSKMLTTLRTTINQDTQGSLCNSAAIISFPEYAYDWVRPGIILYGGSPVKHCHALDINLQPAMEFSAQIMALQMVKMGEAIGYGSQWRAKKDTKTALVSIGYGDGYPRVISQATYVCVLDNTQQQGYRCAVLGRVAMDMIVIDISNTPKDIALGSKVRLWGSTPHVDDVAVQAGTISYELLCRLSTRPKRILA